jgi:recombination protein RecA
VVTRGRVIEIYGPESSGKTTLLLQKLKSRRNCCFIDADTHSTEIMLKNGVDIENLILNQIMESRH